MTKVFSIISMQSGVGKSFVTAVLADFLCGATNNSVLVIDLGGFGTVTDMLIGQDGQDECSEYNLAVRLILDRLDSEHAGFDFDKAVQRGVGNVKHAANIDLLPSRASTAHADIDLEKEQSTDLLRRAVEAHLCDYGVVLVDCPAWIDSYGNFAVRNALRISDGCIIPGNTAFSLLSGTTPLLDTKNILCRAADFGRQIGKEIRLHGIVVNRDAGTFREQRRRRPYVLEQLGGAGMELLWGRPPITCIPEIYPHPFPLGSRSAEYRTLRRKWGYRVTKLVTKFACDILHFEGVVWDP